MTLSEVKEKIHGTRNHGRLNSESYPLTAIFWDEEGLVFKRCTHDWPMLFLPNLEESNSDQWEIEIIK